MTVENKIYSIFIDLFLRSNSRRLPYLYQGFSDEYFIIGSVDEQDLKHHLPGESIGLIELHQNKSIIEDLFTILKFNTFPSSIINIRHVGTYLTKLDYDLTKIKIMQDEYGLYFLNQDKKIYYNIPIKNHFSYMKFNRLITDLITHYKDDNKQLFSLDTGFVKKNKKFKYDLNTPDLKNRSVVLQEGYDIPLYKNKNPHLCLIKQTVDEISNYKFAGYLTHDDLSIFIERINVVLV